MTDNEIIKALDYCKDCYANINIDIIDLINRKQAEIEKLTIENQSLRMAANSYKLHYNEAKSEAYKEFAERLKSYLLLNKKGEMSVISFENVDYLLKEMVGETE